MKKIFLTLSLLLCSAPALAQNETPIVLELFTSQSCSSCPPADKILEKLSIENKNIIALSCNVTYWNHLHWEDTLSKDFCDQRQLNYVRSLNARGPYTPQIVVNGKETMVGSKEGEIRRAISMAKPIKNISLALEENELKISLPETPGDDSYALNLITYTESQEQEIPSGENKGRTVSYTNPIQEIISLGSWDGTGKTMSHDISAIKNIKSYVVLAQRNGRTGTIMAAGKISAK